jgi:hypothetical protein
MVKTVPNPAVTGETQGRNVDGDQGHAPTGTGVLGSE